MRQRELEEKQKMKHDQECPFRPQTNLKQSERATTPEPASVSDRNQKWTEYRDHKVKLQQEEQQRKHEEQHPFQPTFVSDWKPIV